MNKPTQDNKHQPAQTSDQRTHPAAGDPARQEQGPGRAELAQIEVGFQVFGADGGEEFGAVRQVGPQGRAELVINVENAGDFTIPASAIKAVHAMSQKIVLFVDKLDQRLREAISHAHDAEQPDL